MHDFRVKSRIGVFTLETEAELILVRRLKIIISIDLTSVSVMLRHRIPAGLCYDGWRAT